MVKFEHCTNKKCWVCATMVHNTSFTSSANGGLFEGSYEFAPGEPEVLSCRTVNVIYLLQCTSCCAQYVGETVQQLRTRMSNHRATLQPDKEGGNFRLRQHYSGSGGRCYSFTISIIQKLPGTGRTDTPKVKFRFFRDRRGHYSGEEGI